MKTLSKIILEETIRIALNEFDTTPNVQTSDNKTSVNKTLANNIANAIINSTSWYNDREDDLVAAFKSIPNIQTYNEVNKIIKKQKQQNLASFIGSFIAKDESNVWIPVLKHLIKIKAPVKEFKEYYKKTRYIYVSSNAKVNDYITNNSLQSTGISTDDSEKTGDWLLSHIQEFVLTAVAIVACGYLNKALPNISCAKLIFAPFRIPWKTIQSARSGTEIAKVTSQYFKQIDQIFSGTGKYNKRQLIAAIELGVSKGDISKEKAEIAIKLLRDEKNINKVLQMAKFQTVLDNWTRSGKAEKGDALAIANLLPDNLRKKWLPLLQQEEDRLLGNITTNIDKELPIIVRSVKNFITSKVKLEPSVFERWQKIYTKVFPETKEQFTGSVFDNYVNKVIYLIEERKFTPDRAIRSAESDLYNIGSGSQKRQDLNYFIQNHNNLKNFPYYLRLETFPSFKQWKTDMVRVNFSTITEKEYRLQRWLWQNQKS